MEAKKTIGVGVLVIIVIVLGVMIVKQMATFSSKTPSSSSNMMIPKNQSSPKTGLTEEPQTAPMDTKQPATVDAIVGDIEGEAAVDNQVLSDETRGEASVVEEESTSLNEVSTSYDEN